MGFFPAQISDELESVHTYFPCLVEHLQDILSHKYTEVGLKLIRLNSTCRKMCICSSLH